MTAIPVSATLVSTAPAFDLFGFFGLPPLPSAPLPPSPTPAPLPAPNPPEPAPRKLTAEEKKIRAEDHILWARPIARGVRHDYRFAIGSQEELDLEATASLVLVEYAARFDPIPAFRSGAARHIAAACWRYRIGDAVPRGPDSVMFAHVEHTQWAEAIADVVAARRVTLSGWVKWYALRRIARAVAADLVPRFNPDGAFRGWAAIEVRSRCRRVAVQIRAGGTVKTTNDKKVKKMRVGGIPDWCPNCSTVTRPWWEDADPSEESPIAESAPAPQNRRRTRTGRQIAGPPPDALAS